MEKMQKKQVQIKSMQKIFTIYMVIILSAAIFLILLINFLFRWHTLEDQQFDTFQIKIEQIIHTLENNQMELEMMNKSLDEDYLTRAKAASYVLDRQEEVVMDVSEMQYLAKLLNVDELHYIDENGIIASASVSEYIGMNMADYDQTRPFLAILESGDEDAYLIQEARPNAAAGKIMQHIGVARKNKGGFVQVGFEPKRLMEAQSRNTYDYIFAKFPTDVGEELFVVDCGTGDVLGHSGDIGQDFREDCYQLDALLECQEGDYRTGTDGRRIYIVSRQYEDVIICAALPAAVLFQKLFSDSVLTCVYLLLIELAVIFLLNYLVRRRVIDGIHRILEDLSSITNGNLDTTVSVGGNREFEELSRGINTMVTSIINISARISAIIEISGVSLAAFEYESGKNHVFVTSGLGALLEISDQAVAEFGKNARVFDTYIRRVAEKPVEGETNVYQIHDAKYVRIQMSESAGGKLGVITDVTGDVMEKRQMRYENTHDPLTGLYKYPYFKQLAAERLRRMPDGEVCALVMIDLDYFKGVNDTYGHDVGDRYLQSFSAVMSAMPAEQFLTARRSGDEFCMMIFGCGSREEIRGRLDMFYDRLTQNQVMLSDTESRTVSASAGFAWTNDAGSDIAELLSQADEALYKVKRNTKGVYGEFRG